MKVEEMEGWGDATRGRGQVRVAQGWVCGCCLCFGYTQGVLCGVREWWWRSSVSPLFRFCSLPLSPLAHLSIPYSLRQSFQWLPDCSG